MKQKFSKTKINIAFVFYVGENYYWKITDFAPGQVCYRNLYHKLNCLNVCFDIYQIKYIYFIMQGNTLDEPSL